MFTLIGRGVPAKRGGQRLGLLATLLCTTAFATSAFSPAAPAGDGPIIFPVDVESTEVVGWCGFPMEIYTTGTAMVHLWLDDNGEFEQVLITAPATFLTFTNLDTGESVWTPSVNMVMQEVYTENSRIATYRGLFWHLIVPGDGLITADAGRLDLLLTLNPDGTISAETVFSAGLQEGQFLDLVCSVLAA